MSDNLQENTKKPVLSTKARSFVDSYDGSNVPEDIKLEITKYIKDITPFIEKDYFEMVKDFEKVFYK